MIRHPQHEHAIIKAIESAADECRDKANDDRQHYERHQAHAKMLDRLAADFAAHDYDQNLMAQYANQAQGLTITAAAVLLAPATTADGFLAHLIAEMRR